MSLEQLVASISAWNEAHSAKDYIAPAPLGEYFKGFAAALLAAGYTQGRAAHTLAKFGMALYCEHAESCMQEFGRALAEMHLAEIAGAQ